MPFRAISEDFHMPCPFLRLRDGLRSGRSGRIMGGLGLLVVLASLTLFGRPAAAESVSLQLRWDHQFQFAGYYAALWQGYYAEAGLDVEIRPAPAEDGTQRNAAREVIEGRADFGVGAGDVLVERDRGHPLVILASIFQKSPVAFYALETTPLHSPADLVGLRVVRRPGDMVDVELQAMLRAEGVDPSRIPPGLRAQGVVNLLEGTFDVTSDYTITAPWFAERLGLELRALHPSAYGVDFYGDSLFTHQRLVDQNPDLVRRMTAASLKGWEYALTHSEEIADRISRELPRIYPIEDFAGFNRFQIDGVRDLTYHPVVELGHINPRRWERMHAALKEAGLVNGTFDAQRAIFDPDRIAREMAARRQRILIWSAGILAVAVLVSAAATLILRRIIVTRTAELRRSEARYRTLYERTPAMLHSLDRTGRVISVNDHWLAVFGYRRADVIGRSEAAFFDVSSHLRAEIAGLPDRPRSKTLNGFDRRIMTRNGEMRDVQVSATVEFDDQGEIDQILVVSADVTEDHRIRRELMAAKDEAERADRAKTRFLAAASHDLCQPLQALQLYISLLADRMQGAPSAIFENIRLCMASLTSLLDDLLEISRLDAGLVRPNVDVLRLDEIVDRVVAGQRVQAENKGLSLRIVPSNVLVRSDAVLLERILLNLVSNAVRYTASGRILIGCRRSGATVRLQVWDTGIGIPEDKLGEIFREFCQIGNAERNSERGTGLGLAIVERLSRLLGHAVTVNSRPGSGSVFSVTLPIAVGGAAIGRVPALDHAPMPRAFIVVLDDERQVRDALTAILEDWGHGVLSVATPADAVARLSLSGRMPDLVIADFQLGDGLTGVKALHELRERLGPGFTGIILTADTTSDRMREVAESGFGLLHKPLDAARLRDIVAHVLGRSDAPIRQSS